MATQVYGDSGPAVSVGRVFSRAFGVIGNNPATMFGIAFLFGALPSTIVNYLRTSFALGGLGNSDALLGLWILYIGSAILSLIFAMLVQGSLVRATVAFSEGRRAGFGESVSAGFEMAIPLLGLAILMGLALVLGLVLLVVPGIILYIIWSVASPALVEERIGIFQSFGRSSQLTRGARWKVFAVELVIVVAFWLFSLLLGVGMAHHVSLTALRAANAGLPLSWIILNIVSSTLVAAIWSAVQTSLYVELRNWKDGPSVSGLEEIFA